MSNDARTALLALPAEARQYLLEHSEGPGWAWPGPLRPLAPWGLYEGAEGGEWPDDTWLPCSPCEVLQVAGLLIADEPNHEGVMSYRMERVSHHGWLAVIEHRWDGVVTHEGTHSTPLEAAIACFAAAWEAKPQN